MNEEFTGLKEIRAHYEITSCLNRDLPVDQILREVIKKITEILEFDATLIYLADGETGRVPLRGSYGTNLDLDRYLKRVGNAEGIAAKVFQSGTHLIFSDVREDPHYRELSRRRSVEKSGYRFYAVFPIRSRQNPVGTMVFLGRQPRKMTPDEIDLAASLADQVGIGFGKASLLEEIRKAYSEVRILQEVTSTILKSQDLHEAAQSILDAILSAFSFDLGGIYLTSADSPTVERLARSGNWRSEDWWLNSNTQDSERHRLRILREKKLRVVNKLQDGYRMRSLKEEGAQTAVVLPLWVQDEVLGVIQLGSYKPITLSPDRIKTLESIGNQVGMAIQKARLDEESRRKAREQEALNAIASAIGRSLDLNEVLNVAVDKVLKVTDWDRAYLRLKDPETGVVTLAAHRGISAQYVDVLVDKRTPGGKSDQVFATGRSILINDPEGSKLKEETIREGIHAIAWVPVKTSGKVVGVLNVSTGRPVSFSRRAVELLESIGIVIGASVENARLYEKTRRSLERSRALNEIDAAIASSLNVQSILETVLEKIEGVMPLITVSVVRLLNKGTGLLEILASRNLDAEALKARNWGQGGGPSRTALKTAAIAQVLDTQTDPRIRDRDFFRRHGLVSYITIPLMAQAEAFGTLSLYTREKHAFPPEELDFLSNLASHTSMAIYNARLFGQVQGGFDRIQALREIDQAITSTLDLNAVLNVLLEGVTRSFPYETAATIRLLNHETGILEPVAYKNIDGEAWRTSPVKAKGRLGEIMVGQRTPVIIRNVQTDSQRPSQEFYRREGLVSYLGVPLITKEEVFGILSVYTKEERDFIEGEVEFLTMLAAQAAIAIHNARLYEQVRVQAENLKRTNADLRRYEEIQRLLKELSQDITRLDTSALLNKLAANVKENLGVDEVDIRIFRDQERLRSTMDESSTSRLRPSHGRTRWVRENRKPLVIRDLLRENEGSRQPSRRHPETRGYLAVPIFSRGGDVFGVLRAVTWEPREFTPQEVDLTQQMAGGIGIALENARLLDQIRGQAVELERSNRVKSEFLGIMSHELRTPLTVVLGYSEMMLDGMFGPVNSEQEQALREVLTRSKDLLTLINSILEVTRIEAEAVGADREVFHLGDFLMEEVKSAYTDPPDKKLLLRWEKPLEIPVRTDRQKLGQILRNLIDNAIKFTPQGSVTVSARLVPEGSPASDGRDLASPQTRWLAFDVKDTGIGISKEDLPSIFEMFHQVDSSDTRAQGGSGVGLFIVKRFSQLLGGTVEVESEPGRGSTFTVTLPID